MSVVTGIHLPWEKCLWRQKFPDLMMGSSPRHNFNALCSPQGQKTGEEDHTKQPKKPPQKPQNLNQNGLDIALPEAPETRGRPQGMPGSTWWGGSLQKSQVGGATGSISPWSGAFSPSTLHFLHIEIEKQHCLQVSACSWW